MTEFPEWIRRRWPSGHTFESTRHIIDKCGLNTVCVNARCPNIGECYARRHATFLILGNACTRSCAFCSVAHGTPQPVSDNEPERVARAAAEMELRHVVITSVTRDDLPDGGADQFVRTIAALRSALPQAAIEVLTPDFRGRAADIETVVNACPDVFGHNVETVPRLTSSIRNGAEYTRSLDVLVAARNADMTKQLVIKSGLMVGMGERYDEVVGVLKDLRDVGCQIVTIGQYLRPGNGQVPVHEFVRPETFDMYREEGLKLGFADVAAGPFVRSSYRADEMLEAARKNARQEEGI